MCTVRKHYEYRPVWPSDYQDPFDAEPDPVLDSWEDEELTPCACGREVSWAVREECNDLAYICPDRDL